MLQLVLLVLHALLHSEQHGSPSELASFSRRKIKFTSLPIKLSSPIEATPPIATAPK